jgi:ACS family tartrate transporter-like MFS transporter
MDVPSRSGPTILLGIVVLLYVTDRPAQARWLNDEERAWLVRFAR